MQLDGGGWEFDKIGTERERSSVESELRELKEKMKSVDSLRERLSSIEKDLARVFIQGGEELPAYEEGEPSNGGLGESAVLVGDESPKPAEEVDLERETSADAARVGAGTRGEGLQESPNKESDMESESFEDASESRAD